MDKKNIYLERWTIHSCEILNNNIAPHKSMIQNELFIENIFKSLEIANVDKGLKTRYEC